MWAIDPLLPCSPARRLAGNKAASEGCVREWGVEPRASWAVTHFGDKQRSLQTASNMVFSNGLLDPWAAGGVLHNISESVVAVVIPSGCRLPPPLLAPASCLPRHSSLLERAASHRHPTLRQPL